VAFAVQAIQHCRIVWNWKFFHMKCFVANQHFSFQFLMGMGTVVCGDDSCGDGVETMLKLLRGYGWGMSEMGRNICPFAAL